jgi:hypothetical protein
MVLFVLLALAASLAGGLQIDSGAWPERRDTLLGTRKTMLEAARLHQPLTLPGYPGSTPFCQECHSLPPHAGNGVAAVLLNHHAHAFECLICHWASSEGKMPEMVWSRSGAAAAGDPGGGRRGLTLGLADNGDGGRDLPAMRNRVISKRVCFQRGPSCRECHRRGGMERFRKPGATASEVAFLEKLPDFLVLSKGARWYFPQLQ